ncbi:large ribosomal subunit protein mL66-like [Watersipora subatra]|uniref:large ribosomal subunit protein mL66-like n=1 Tax=Watersipora subatra TaxID=2589382 RepID=UPI00355BD66C
MAFLASSTKLMRSVRPLYAIITHRAHASKSVIIPNDKPSINDIKVRPPKEKTAKLIRRSEREDGTITIEGRYTEPYTRHVIDMEKGACPLCSLAINVEYTDVLILKQFMRKDGILLPRIYTGLCAKQQRHMDVLVHKAHNAGLLDALQPPLPDGRIRKPKQESKYKFRGLNRYFTDKY